MMDSVKMPMYLFDQEGFASNIRELKEAFQSHYSNFDIAYSFKTNYLKAACETVLSLGCYAEVVSQFEYEYARQLGFSDEKIVFNGVIPSEYKYHLLCAGGIVNVDSLNEYLQIESMANYYNTPIKIGIRLNFDVDGIKSRFGIELHGPDFDEIVSRISCNPLISLSGFHHHIHGKRSVQDWIKRANLLITLAKTYGIEYIDLGGGLWGKMPNSMLVQFSEKPNTYQEYGEQIGNLFVNAFPDASVKLIVEPGMGLIGDVMMCVSHVISVKTIKGKQYVQLDIDGAATAFSYSCDESSIKKPFHILRTGDGKLIDLTKADFVGTTCTEFDVLVRNFTGELSIGDSIVFEHVGAYTLVTSRQFITPRLGVYDLHTLECLRKPETSQDMFNGYLGV